MTSLSFNALDAIGRYMDETDSWTASGASSSTGKELSVGSLDLTDLDLDTYMTLSSLADETLEEPVSDLIGYWFVRRDNGLAWAMKDAPFAVDVDVMALANNVI